jgi:hypothetical protein
MKSLPINITSINIYSTIVIRFITSVDENLRDFFEKGDYFSFGSIPDNSLLIMLYFSNYKEFKMIITPKKNGNRCLFRAHAFDD